MKTKFEYADDRLWYCTIEKTIRGRTYFISGSGHSKVESIRDARARLKQVIGQ